MLFPPHPDRDWNAKPFSGNAEPQRWTARHMGQRMVCRETFFANPTASSAPYPQKLNPWSSNASEHTSPHVMSESQTQFRIRDCQSGPSARNSVVPSEGGFSKNYGADQQRLQISDAHFDNFLTSATFACWKIRVKTEVCTCSQFPTELCLDQRSGIGWFSGWSKIFVLCKRNSNAKFWSTRCKDCFSTEQNYP